MVKVREKGIVYCKLHYDFVLYICIGNILQSVFCSQDMHTF